MRQIIHVKNFNHIHLCLTGCLFYSYGIVWRVLFPQQLTNESVQVSEQHCSNRISILSSKSVWLIRHVAPCRIETPTFSHNAKQIVLLNADGNRKVVDAGSVTPGREFKNKRKYCIRSVSNSKSNRGGNNFQLDYVIEGGQRGVQCTSLVRIGQWFGKKMPKMGQKASGQNQKRR